MKKCHALIATFVLGALISPAALGQGQASTLTRSFIQALRTKNPFQEGSAALLLGSLEETFDFSLPGSETMLLAINGGTPVTLDFMDSDFLIPAAATAAEVAAAMNADFAAAGLTDAAVAIPASGFVAISTNQVGALASLKITDGVGNPALILGLSQSLVTGAEYTATLSTRLNDLPTNVADYTTGDVILISGQDADGTRFTTCFVYGASQDGTTLGDLESFANYQFSKATVTLDSSGFMWVIPHYKYVPYLDLKFRNTFFSNGRTNWSHHRFQPVRL